MQYFRLIFLLFLLLQIGPKIASAGSDLSAGFAPNSVWVSKSNVTAGNSVNIFTVLYNSSQNSITGKLDFLIDDIVVGTNSFTVPAGETQVESVSWTASAGKHLVLAKISEVFDTNTKTAVSVANQTTGSQSINVEPAPPPPPPTPPSKATQTINLVTNTIQAGIASSTPIVKRVLSSIYNMTESLRTTAEKSLAKKVENNTKSTGNTQSAKTQETGFLPTTQKHLANAVFAVVSSKLLFYFGLVLSVVFIFLMLKMILKDRKRKNKY